MLRDQGDAASSLAAIPEGGIDPPNSPGTPGPIRDWVMRASSVTPSSTPSSVRDGSDSSTFTPGYATRDQ
jgi:hypothetical protein